MLYEYLEHGVQYKASLLNCGVKGVNCYIPLPYCTALTHVLTVIKGDIAMVTAKVYRHAINAPMSGLYIECLILCVDDAVKDPRQHVAMDMGSWVIWRGVRGEG